MDVSEKSKKKQKCDRIVVFKGFLLTCIQGCLNDQGARGAGFCKRHL